MVALARFLADFVGTILYYTRPVSDNLIYYAYSLLMGKTKPLPPIRNKLLLMSVKETAEKIRNRQIKSEDVVRAYVERAQAVEPFINAITDARYAEALEDAKQVDRFLESGSKTSEEIEKETPLLGVPFTCKEAIGIKGLAQTCGLLNDKNRKAEKDSDSAELYRAAGAIPLTVTNVPQLCMWWDSSNLNFGICRNPYDNHRTVGGSTGGEGALLTSAGALIGIGNDIGGSIRIPASFNGIYGHKPSTGIVSNAGDYPDFGDTLDHFVSTGPMCRYAEDLPLLMKILTGKKSNLLQLESKVNFRNVKVYFMEEFPGPYKAVQEIKKSVRQAATYFEEQYGIKAIPLRIGELEYAFYMWECKMLETNVAPFKTALVDENGKVHLWWEVFKSLFGRNKHTLPVIFYGMIERRDKDQFYYDCLEKYKSMERKFADIFREDAIVLLPSHPELPPFYHLTIPKFVNIGYTAIFSTLGFPSTNIPAGFSCGLPIGIQAISGQRKDHLTIAAAQELDRYFGGWKGPSAIEIS